VLYQIKTRHWDTCSSNPGVGEIFSLFLWPFSVTPYCLLGQVLFLVLQFQFGGLKAAAHVAVRPSVLLVTDNFSYLRVLVGEKTAVEERLYLGLQP